MRDYSLRKTQVAAIFLVGFLIGAVLQKTLIAHLTVETLHIGFKRGLESAYRYGDRIVSNYFAGLSAKANQFQIEVEPKHLRKLEMKREKALKQGVLLSSSEDYVEARIMHNNKTLSGNIRLKGDWIDHIQGQKWSFRIKLGRNDTLLGMRKFSLHHPHARNNLEEWIFLEASRKEGLVALRYDFVWVTLNGKNLGIYAIEEGFDRQLLLNNKRKEGVILKEDESTYWATLASSALGGTRGYFDRSLRNRFASSVLPFQYNSVMASDQWYEQFIEAHHLFEKYRSGQIPLTEAFDIPKLATYYALADVYGAYHGLAWHNRRYYFNLETKRLEPIPFDNIPGRQMTSLLGSYKQVNKNPAGTASDPFSDPIFFVEYTRALERLSQTQYLRGFKKHIRQTLRTKQAILNREFPRYHRTWYWFRENQRRIRSLLHPPTATRSYVMEMNKGVLRLKVKNVQPLPIEVTGLYVDGVRYKPINNPLISSVKDPVEGFSSVRFLIDPSTSQSDIRTSPLKLEYHLLGMKESRQDPVNPWPYPEKLT